MSIVFENRDCMDAMREFEAGFFDLAIVDPPYGIGLLSMTFTKNDTRMFGNMATQRRDYRKQGEWDKRPDRQYFDELRRVSKRQIIWGYNYFTDMLPPAKGFIVWDKRCIDSMTNDFSDCELAYLSEGQGVARIFRYMWNGMIQGNMANKEDRFHPTQKPVQLYQWILDRYAKKSDKILDTHVGSASSLIACGRLGFDAWGYEIDADYYQQAKARLDRELAQGTLF